MTWIKTIRLEEDERVREAVMGERKLYPAEYATPAPSVDRGFENSIVGSHTLFPDVLFHSFSAFGAMLSPELPLRREQHEMIATMVSVTNRCFY
ncbi:MAG TPA: hypothetical protein VEI54_12135 [Candidatus Limnocylindrales bacterium]|nr:hypothetical protein [Candidatus Limnocylindrales bacterium]